MANCRRIIRPIVQAGVLSIFSNLLNRWQQRFDLCCRYCNGWLHSCVSCLYIVLLVYYVSFLLYSHVTCVLFCFTMGQHRTCWGQSLLSIYWVVDAVCDTDWRGEVRSGTTWSESTTSTVIWSTSDSGTTVPSQSPPYYLVSTRLILVHYASAQAVDVSGGIMFLGCLSVCACLEHTYVRACMRYPCACMLYGLAIVWFNLYYVL